MDGGFRGAYMTSVLKIKHSSALLVFIIEERVQSHGSLLVLLMVYIIPNDARLKIKRPSGY